ncbi:hypothetical protein A374_13280 [Fictibacillus macauensis ZFHKF-1]|uniref:YfhS protein n=1 Tax=Fictibacillus macauensis ZFHKF-1 TaxID=1196324 RepID=I8IYW0_9BACL|nr:hypothetical protein [Fictibacillus macauensis]EIT84666.1 hypothetical protein A374_13280 [Fictibacillus macauensis ZFHKF-1]
MYVGRDLTQLGMMSKKEWSDVELAHFHSSFQQITPFLNAEGVAIHRDIIEEIKARGGLASSEASYEHGTITPAD